MQWHVICMSLHAITCIPCHYLPPKMLLARDAGRVRSLRDSDAARSGYLAEAPGPCGPRLPPRPGRRDWAFRPTCQIPGRQPFTEYYQGDYSTPGGHGHVVVVT